MSKSQIFIDGESGTTGLQIRQRLEHHPDIDIVSIDYEKRRDQDEKLKILREVDVCVLCLPDDAAKESAQLIQNEKLSVKVLDASSAHRTHPDWVYGLPELAPQQRNTIKSAQYVSNPGCYATGAIMLLRPLIEKNLLGADHWVSLNAVSGYSGGGKKLIEAYENKNGLDQVPVIGLYGLNFSHKHTPEIEQWAGLNRRPLFIPSVANYHQGMLVHTSFAYDDFSGEVGEASVLELYQTYYNDEPLVKIHPLNSIDEGYAPYLSPHNVEGSNDVHLYVYASDVYREVMVIAKFDNLGKGASGAAVQNLNIMLGYDEYKAVALPA